MFTGLAVGVVRVLIGVGQNILPWLYNVQKRLRAVFIVLDMYYIFMPFVFVYLMSEMTLIWGKLHLW